MRVDNSGRITLEPHLTGRSRMMQRTQHTPDELQDLRISPHGPRRRILARRDPRRVRNLP